MHTVMRTPSQIVIGDNCAIGQYVYLDGLGDLEIGNNVNITTGVSIYSAAHDVHSPKWDFFKAKVTIGNNVWIASNSVVIQGITVNEGAVVAAGSVVVKDVPAFDIVGGNPAKKIGKRPHKIDYLTNYFPFLY